MTRLDRDSTRDESINQSINRRRCRWMMRCDASARLPPIRSRSVDRRTTPVSRALHARRTERNFSRTTRASVVDAVVRSAWTPANAARLSAAAAPRLLDRRRPGRTRGESRLEVTPPIDARAVPFFGGKRARRIFLKSLYCDWLVGEAAEARGARGASRAVGAGRGGPVRGMRSMRDDDTRRCAVRFGAVRFATRVARARVAAGASRRVSRAVGGAGGTDASDGLETLGGAKECASAVAG